MEISQDFLEKIRAYGQNHRCKASEAVSRNKSSKGQGCGRKSKIGCMPVPWCCREGNSNACVIARALAVNPEVLLLDESCSTLDPISAGRIEELLHTLKERLTAVNVTHTCSRVLAFTI